MSRLLQQNRAKPKPTQKQLLGIIKRLDTSKIKSIKELLPKNLEDVYKDPLAPPIDELDPKTMRLVPGIASLMVQDREGDIIVPRAFVRSLPTYMKNPVLRYNHENGTVIGRVLFAWVDDDGLNIIAEIARGVNEDDLPEKIWNLIKQRMLRAFSIMGAVNDYEYLEDSEYGGYLIKDLELMEISVVDIPANQEALFSVLERSIELKRKMSKKKGEKMTKVEKDASVEPTPTEPQQAPVIEEQVIEQAQAEEAPVAQETTEMPQDAQQESEAPVELSSEQEQALLASILSQVVEQQERLVEENRQTREQLAELRELLAQQQAQQAQPQIAEVSASAKPETKKETETEPEAVKTPQTVKSQLLGELVIVSKKELQQLVEQAVEKRLANLNIEKNVSTVVRKAVDSGAIQHEIVPSRSETEAVGLSKAIELMFTRRE